MNQNLIAESLDGMVKRIYSESKLLLDWTVKQLTTGQMKMLANSQMKKLVKEMEKIVDSEVRKLIDSQMKELAEEKEKKAKEKKMLADSNVNVLVSNSVNECKIAYKSDWASILMKINLDLGMWMLQNKANGLFPICKDFLEASAKIQLDHPDTKFVTFSKLNPNLSIEAYKSIVANIQANPNDSSAQNVINSFGEMICNYCHFGEFKQQQ